MNCKAIQKSSAGEAAGATTPFVAHAAVPGGDYLVTAAPLS
jgi:hypothetical protein